MFMDMWGMANSFGCCGVVIYMCVCMCMSVPAHKSLFTSLTREKQLLLSCHHHHHLTLSLSPNTKHMQLGAPFVAMPWYVVTVYFGGPVVAVIVIVTIMNILICQKVYRIQKASQKWSVRKTMELSKKVFWQSVFYVTALYVTLPFVLLSYYVKYSGGGDSFWVYAMASLMAPIQGFINMLVYFQRTSDTKAEVFARLVLARAKRLSSELFDSMIFLTRRGRFSRKEQSTDMYSYESDNMMHSQYQHENNNGGAAAAGGSKHHSSSFHANTTNGGGGGGASSSGVGRDELRSSLSQVDPLSEYTQSGRRRHNYTMGQHGSVSGRTEDLSESINLEHGCRSTGHALQDGFMSQHELAEQALFRINSEAECNLNDRDNSGRGSGYQHGHESFSGNGMYGPADNMNHDENAQDDDDSSVDSQFAATMEYWRLNHMADAEKEQPRRRVGRRAGMGFMGGFAPVPEPVQQQQPPPPHNDGQHRGTARDANQYQSEAASMPPQATTPKGHKNVASGFWHNGRDHGNDQDPGSVTTPTKGIGPFGHGKVPKLSGTVLRRADQTSDADEPNNHKSPAVVGFFQRRGSGSGRGGNRRRQSRSQHSHSNDGSGDDSGYFSGSLSAAGRDHHGPRDVDRLEASGQDRIILPNLASGGTGGSTASDGD